MTNNLVKFFNELRYRKYARFSYSQEGEDLILQRLFPDYYTGFYVDVGAHHPVRFSNTHLLYKQGWSGINIDAAPGSMDAFRILRTRDVNIECGISNEPGLATYYQFNEPALNGFSKDLSEYRDSEDSPYSIINTVELRLSKLSELLEKYLPNGRQIDFLTVDVEGMDYEVLLSNDWSKFRPKFVLIEILNTSLLNVLESPCAQLLSEKGYTPFSKCVNTVFFEDTEKI